MSRTIVIVLGGGTNVDTDGWSKLHNRKHADCKNEAACMHQTISYSFNGDTIHFVNEVINNLTIEFEGLVNEGEPSAIAVHKSSRREGDVLDAVCGRNIPVKTFSRLLEEETKIWKNLKPFIDNCLFTGKYDSFKKYFDDLWKVLVPSKAAITDELRSELLIPLVALDWLQQLNNRDPKAKEPVITAMAKESYEECLKELSNHLGSIDCIRVLKKMISSKIVDHAGFKKAAEELENAIDELWEKECCAQE